jgi:pyrrolidone-carboxylate peptidase
LIILTGFGPFGKYKKNLSSQIVKTVPLEFDGFQFTKEIVPVSWKDSISTYNQLLTKLNVPPELVILLGIHSKKEIHLETYGWNFKFGDDNDKKVKFGPIIISHSVWIKTMLNLNKIYSHLEDKSKISISYFPGFYICNYLYFWALWISKKAYPVIFIHFPDKGDVSEHILKFEKIFKTIKKVHFKK